MKVGDMIEVYRHIPKHEAGIIPTGMVGRGLIVQITETLYEEPVVIYVNDDGVIDRAVIHRAGISEVMTLKVIS